MYRTIIGIVLLCAGCATADPRTDYEMARGITLTQQQKRDRELLKQRNLEVWEAIVRYEIDQARLVEMVYCDSVEIESIC